MTVLMIMKVGNTRVTVKYIAWLYIILCDCSVSLSAGVLHWMLLVTRRTHRSHGDNT